MLLLLPICHCLAQVPEGTWYARQAVTADSALHYLLSLRKSEFSLSAKLDLLSESTFRVRIDSLSWQAPALLLHHQGLNWAFEGQLSSRGDSLPGQLSREGSSAPLVWTKTPQIARQQRISLPLPYETQEVSISHAAAKLELAGTLTMPQGEGPFPAVVLITGSGPQNRDEEILGHYPYAVLADYLTRQGIAVLRYDDRGTAASTGDFGSATMLDLAADAQAALRFLQSQPGVDTARTGLLGHSEGGNIAPYLAAQDHSINFIVLLAAPGVSNLQMYLKQLEYVFAEESPESYARDVPFWSSVYEAMAGIADSSTLADSLDHLFGQWLAAMPAEELSWYGDTARYKQAEVVAHTDPWYHGFLRFDVADYLPRVNAPILALNGTKDHQVDARQNLSGWEQQLKALHHPHYEVVYLADVNHFMQPSKEGTIGEVYFLPVSFDQRALTKISHWIKSLEP